MTDRVEALKALIEKVENPQSKPALVMQFEEEVRLLNLSIVLVLGSFGGSIGGAESLHQKEIPDWGWSISSAGLVILSHADFYEIKQGHELPARAWLLAILRAKLAELEAGE